MPRFFTMKMRGGINAPDDSCKVAAFVTENSCVGIGDPDAIKGSGTFLKEIQVGDIVVLRSGGSPLVLLEITSDSYKYQSEGKYPDFDEWMMYVRNVKVISWYAPMEDVPEVHMDARGYMHTCSTIKNDQLLSVVQRWYDIVKKQDGSARDNCRPAKPQKGPNIFSFATSELTQDAMFAWIMQWADPKYTTTDPALNKLAQDFVRVLLGKDSGFTIESIQVGRQWNNIDIWAEINDDCFLTIEDKTGTTIHDNQLQRYRENVEKEYAGKRSNLFFTYIKTGNEPDSILRQVREHGYRIIGRREILACFQSYREDNYLLTSYLDHLQVLEDDTQSFHYIPVEKWSSTGWQGFYQALEGMLDIDSWGYVANPSGGFWGAWWYFSNFGGGQMYLQFEESKLCFKICPSCEKEMRASVREECYELLMQTAQNDFSEIERPYRFGTGTYMTIAVVRPENLFGTGIICMDEIIRKLKRYESLIDKCCATNNQNV